MSYLALYRKYRPVIFEDVVGQEPIITTIQNALAQNKIAHAYLFSGPRGTGKTSLARLVAKALECEEGVGHICTKCFSCQAILSNSHPDIYEIDAASNNGVDQVRTLVDNVKFAPLRGRYKVFIIDEIHMMSNAAFNALLKTLEEPPSHVIFIFATTEPHKVLPTIMSRVQHFAFARVSDLEIEKRLKKILNLEEIPFEEEALKQIVSLSDGGMRDALSMCDEAIAYGNGTILLKNVLSLFSLLSNENKLSLILHLLNQDKEKLAEELNKVIIDGVDIKRLTMDLLSLLKNILLYNLTKGKKELLSVKGELLIPFIKVPTNEINSLISFLLKMMNEYKNIVNLPSYFVISLLNYQPETSLKIKSESLTKDDEKELKKEVLKADLVTKKPKEVISTPNQYRISDDFIISLMGVGNKVLKKTVTEKWSELDQFFFDDKLSQYAALLNNGKPYIVYKDFLVLKYDLDEDVKRVNSVENHDLLQEIIFSLTGTKFHPLAIGHKEGIRIYEDFKERYEAGILKKETDLNLKYEDLL